MVDKKVCDREKMKDTKQIRQELMEYIKANDKSWSRKDLNNYSLTELIIIKTEIEIRFENKQRNKEE